MTRLRVTASSLNVRSGPNIDDEPVGTLRNGEVVRLIERSPDGYWLHVDAPDARRGWCSHKYLTPIPPEAEVEEFPWMAIAVRELGVSEISGPENNPRIIEYVKSATLKPNEPVSDSGTAWCSGFVNWCVEKAGYAGTDSLWARDWRKWGRALEVPRRGCIVVFRRKCDKFDAQKSCGHVAFYVSNDGTDVEVLGGNQGNRVSYDSYPIADVLAYRVPM